jgi:hypothetical protein
MWWWWWGWWRRRRRRRSTSSSSVEAATHLPHGAAEIALQRRHHSGAVTTDGHTVLEA